MKFKEFYLVVNGSDDLAEACMKHGMRLGYEKLLFKEGCGIHYIWFKGSGYVGWDFDGCMSNPGFKRMTLDNFFKLTPEDVRVGPEKFQCYFELKVRDSTAVNSGDLTQDQIDRITEIMGEL